MKSSISLAMALALFMSMVIGCRESKPKPSSYSVTYEVTSTDTGAASLTYANDNGSTEQQTVPLPWIKRFTAKPGQFLYLSAQNSSEYGGLTIRINIDGKTVKVANSHGGYSIATTSLYCCEP